MNLNDIVDNYTRTNSNGEESSNSMRNRMNEWADSFDNEESEWNGESE